MILNTGEEWQPEEADIIQWQRAYPAVDVHRELLAMESWLNANPKNRKTKSGIMRFVNSWLSRAQNSGGSPMARKSYKSTSMRAMSITDERTDISWLSGETKERMKAFYLQHFGQYFDGETVKA